MAPSFAWTVPERWQPQWDVSAVRTEPEGRIDRSLAELDEPALVEACLAGRPGAFDVIVERHQRSVYQLCYRFVSNHEDAADLSQDVFVRAYRGLGASPADRVLKQERATRVRQAIAQLPRKQKATLILRIYHEMPHQQIAEILGSSVGAVKANFFHALNNLKKLLGDEML